MRRAPNTLTFIQVIRRLKEGRNPRNIAGMKRFGITGKKRLGLSMPHLRSLARDAGVSHVLARQLWRTGIPEAMIVASLVDDPSEVTSAQMDSWVNDLESWDVCDQLCMNLFRKSPLAWQKIKAWSGREEEFVKRAAFALLACLAVHDDSVDDAKIIRSLLPIRRAAAAERNFVKKAVSWALRSIGKRNLRMRSEALKTARTLKLRPSAPARWIAADAIRELERLPVPRQVTFRQGHRRKRSREKES